MESGRRRHRVSDVMTRARRVVVRHLSAIGQALFAYAVGAPATFLGTGLAELNGWFLGLACGTFFAVGPGLAAAILLGGVIVALLSIAMHRVLATWDVPLVIGPY